MGSRIRLLGFNSWICYLLAIMNVSMFLNLSKSLSLIYKMGIIRIYFIGLL